MGFAITTGQAATEAQPVAITVDKANMTYFSMDKRPSKSGKPNMVVICWDLGYDDAGGVFVPVSSHRHIINDDPTFDSFLLNVVGPGNTYAEEFDTGVFGYLQLIGAVAPGVVESAGG